jgi:hypothetical protein
MDTVATLILGRRERQYCSKKNTNAPKLPILVLQTSIRAPAWVNNVGGARCLAHRERTRRSTSAWVLDHSGGGLARSGRIGGGHPFSGKDCTVDDGLASVIA